MLSFSFVLMTKCWLEDAQARPTFQQLVLENFGGLPKLTQKNGFYFSMEIMPADDVENLKNTKLYFCNIYIHVRCIIFHDAS